LRRQGKKRWYAPDVMSPRARLKANTLPPSPGNRVLRVANHQPRQLLVGRTFGDAQNIGKKLLFGVCPGQNVGRRLMHTTHVACMPAVPPRYSGGADSRMVTDAPAPRAVSAAHRAALPPPITTTSEVRVSRAVYIFWLSAQTKHPGHSCSRGVSSMRFLSSSLPRRSFLSAICARNCRPCEFSRINRSIQSYVSQVECFLSVEP